MATGFWTSVSGAAAQIQAVDAVANNLANADTLGFKKDAPTFKEYLATAEREKVGLDIPRGAIKDKEFYPIDGRDQSFVVNDGTYTNFRQGALRVTQSPLDLALDGPGFLEVATPSGVKYTRAGALKISSDGTLMTAQGYPVLSAQAGGLAAPAATNPQDPQGAALRTPAAQASAQADALSRSINLRDRGSNFSVSPTGEIYSGEDLIARLNVVEFQNLNGLRKSGDSLFENKAPNNLISGTPSRTIVRQGVIEGSNVNPVEEMTNLIKANRLFEHDMKAMKTYGEMMQREVNDLGKL